MSLAEPIPGRILGVGFSLANYRDIFGNAFFLQTFWTTIKIAGETAILALVLGFPLAYFLSRTRSRWKGLLLFLTLAPILVSVVVRAYGWIVLLSNRGLVNEVLKYAGLIDSPVRMIFNEMGVVIGTAHVLLPFMVLSIMASLQTIDPAYEEAANSLGASPFRVFIDIVVRLAMPGIGAGTLLVFILAASTFVTPILLGGQTVMTIPILAYQQFSSAFNWPFGSALVVCLLVIILVISIIADRMLSLPKART